MTSVVQMTQNVTATVVKKRTTPTSMGIFVWNIATGARSPLSTDSVSNAECALALDDFC